jgi:hypothetical protein
MKHWIKLTKFFQGGSHEEYFHLDESEIQTDEQQQELMENWGESSDGGHAYGYRVELHVMAEKEYPPKAWLEKHISAAKREINYIKEEKVLTKKQRIQIQRDKIALFLKFLTEV